jgi:hypothetical protein
VNLTAEQRDKVVEYLDGPCQLREAADMLEVSWPAFADDYSRGMADSEAGRASEAATWYLACRAARSRTLAKLRAEAHATAGSRESADLLRVLEALTSEPEPMPSTHDNPRASGSLALVDALADPTLSADERAELSQLSQDFHAAGMAVFEALLQRDERRRARAGQLTQEPEAAASSPPNKA